MVWAGKTGGTGQTPATSGAPTSTAPATGGKRRASVDGRAQTRLAWAERQPAQFGYARLSARLTAAGKPLQGRSVTIGIGGTLLLTPTGRDGIATVLVPPSRPLPPGAHLVTVSFRGGTTYAPSSLKLLVRVRNSRATVTTGGARRLTGPENVFSIRFDGHAVVGFLRIRAGSHLVEARRLNALGVSADRSSAWFAGTTQTGRRIVGRITRNTGAGDDLLRVWVGGRALPVVRGLDVRIQPRR